MSEIQKFFEWKNLYQFLQTNLLKIFIIIVVFKISSMLKKHIDRVIKSLLEKSSIDKSVASFLRSGFSIFYYIILGFTLIEFLGINLSSITTFLGAAGIILGLAFKETLGNICGGLIILTFKPFKVGHTIEYETYIGDVKSIELFYTRIKTPQNELVIIPNGLITNNEIRNMTKEKVRRLDLKVGVSYDSDIMKVKNVLNEVLNEEKIGEGKMVLKIPEPIIGVLELGDSSIVFCVYAYVKSENYFKLRLKLNEKIKLKFDENNIKIPFPQMDIHVSNNN
ncbi:MAG: mechanosensitive ion channel family protein [Leptotrichiaceae bacterium]|nr:mechanosensitive ion channel family protein [Leptotrichiaceae bacterium]MBP6280748.1 mechanosensitive ion channel family protein [Leptotrichiaceae bacterium]MBP7100811.1 mechanosensitive ion channel family protein [Leptotrichiaceae bacterium]MBP7739423.1 mechanosensitive ion channel family protein [Leptotrichiaceae bacterium]MBP9629267.1 mechanosensitive ion channel family protein [Leptotrichiaceae bacterium]